MDEHLLARLEAIDGRLSSMEKSMGVINHEMGVLCGKVKGIAAMPSVTPLLIKCVVLPLIVITGALVGVKLI